MSKNSSIRSSQNGFAVVYVVIGVLIVAAVVGGLILFSNKDKTTSILGQVPKPDQTTYSPTDIPKKLLQYPGSQIKISETAVEGSSLEMELDSSGLDPNVLSDKVLAYYKLELPKMGWKIGVREGAYSESAGLLLFYDDKYDGTVAVIGLSDNKIFISISTAPPYLLR